MDNLGLDQTVEQSANNESLSEIRGTASAGANFVVAKGKGELSTALGSRRSSGTTKSRSTSSRVTAINGLRTSNLPLVIDDFHYLPRNLQGDLVRALKPLIFDGLPVVIIAIPHRRFDAVKVEREMTGRIFSIEIPTWTEEELHFIPQQGFQLLNLKLDKAVLEKLATEAIGSPHLMQDFCRQICRSKSVVFSAIKSKLLISEGELEQVFRTVADSIGRPIFEKLARGPRQRTDRVPRELKSGETVDIYYLILAALAHLKPGLVTLEYEELRTAIRDVSATAIPQLHEVSRVLKHMATIAATDQSSTPVIDFEEEEKKLHITDPFFAFYLRWGELAAK